MQSASPAGEARQPAADAYRAPVVLTMLERLFDEAHADLEIQGLAGLLELFQPEPEGGQG